VVRMDTPIKRRMSQAFDLNAMEGDDDDDDDDDDDIISLSYLLTDCVDC